MLNHSVNFKQNLKGFFFVLIIAAGLFGTSCLGATKDKGEVSFSIPATALQAIAARAGEIAEGSGYTQPQQEQIALTLKLSLHLASNGKTIAAKTKEGNLKDWLEEQEPLYFSFTGITTNIEIYAEASVTAVINGQTKELGHNKSDSKTVYEGENDFSFTIKLDTKDLSGNNGQTPKPTPGPNTDTTIKFNITITNDDTAVNNMNPAVSLFYIDEQKASMLSGTGYADISNPQVFMELMQNNQNFLNTFDVHSNNDNSFTIQTQFTSGEKIAAGKKLYLLAVANYDDWDLFENETLASQQAKITSYRGWTNELTVGAENEVSIELERADIPCKVSYKKYTDETCTAFDNLENTSYVKIASYNENVTTNHLILDALQNELTAICPDNYELADKMITEFEDNFVTATVYFKPKAQSQNPNTGGGGGDSGGGGSTQTTYTGGGSITINPSTNPNANLLEITATPSEKFYLNTGSINLGAVIKQNGTDLSDNTSVTWNAQLLYGGVDINDFGIEYYTLFRDGSNKWSVQLSRKLETGGTYQLYVTAAYQGIKSSMMTNVNINNSLLYEYNLSNPDDDEFYNFYNQFFNDKSNLSVPGFFIISGSLNEDETTATSQFQDLVTAINSNAQQNFAVDISNLTSGVSELPCGNSFENSRLTAIILPDSITTIKEQTFKNNTQLQSITIPGTIETIEEGAIYCCPSLAEIKFTSENSTYYTDATGSLYKTDSVDTILLYPSTTLLINPDFTTTGVTKIGGYAFYNANLSGDLNLSGINSISETSFKYAKIPSITSFGNITEIPANAFERSEISGTVNLTGITSIGEKAFYYSELSGALDLTGISSLGEYAFAETQITSITSYGNVTTLPAYVFYNSKLSGELDLTGFTSIGNYAFAKTGITSITSFGTFTETPKGAFSECESLTTINLENVTTIGESSFYGCSSLSTLENSESLTTINGAGFRKCNFAKFTITNNLTLGSSALVEAVEELTIDIAITATNASSIINNYIKNISGVKHVIFAQSAVIPDEGSSFKLRQSDQNPTPNLPASTIALNGAFLYYFRRTLESIEFKGANSSIGGTQFINYTQLTQVITNGNVTSIGNFTFYGCTSLASIDLEGVTCVGTCAFENCTALSEITIGNTIKQIGQRAFYNATGLSNTTISIPVSVFAIGNSAFYSSEQTQPVITIAHIEAGEGIETWYNFSTNSSTTDTYWTTTIINPSTGACPDNVSSNGATTITGSDQDTIDNTIISAVTTSSGSISYLRKIEN